MPEINRTRLENAANALGYSRGRSKRIAASILARPDLDDIEAVFAEWSPLTYPDPTGEEVVDRILLAILADRASHELETP